jgi:hypothetical protein
MKIFIVKHMKQWNLKKKTFLLLILNRLNNIAVSVIINTKYYGKEVWL